MILCEINFGCNHLIFTSTNNLTMPESKRKASYGLPDSLTTNAAIISQPTVIVLAWHS